ncbi:hypothetical protein EMIHUDRAFT_453387, partial [Emiliania huxleyi CCMP1516]
NVLFVAVHACRACRRRVGAAVDRPPGAQKQHSWCQGCLGRGALRQHRQRLCRCPRGRETAALASTGGRSERGIGRCDRPGGGGVCRGVHAGGRRDTLARHLQPGRQRGCRGLAGRRVGQASPDGGRRYHGSGGGRGTRVARARLARRRAVHRGVGEARRRALAGGAARRRRAPRRLRRLVRVRARHPRRGRQRLLRGGARVDGLARGELGGGSGGGAAPRLARQGRVVAASRRHAGHAAARATRGAGRGGRAGRGHTARGGATGGAAHGAAASAPVAGGTRRPRLRGCARRADAGGEPAAVRLRAARRVAVLRDDARGGPVRPAPARGRVRAPPRLRVHGARPRRRGRGAGLLLHQPADQAGLRRRVHAVDPPQRRRPRRPRRRARGGAAWLARGRCVARVRPGGLPRPRARRRPQRRPRAVLGLLGGPPLHDGALPSDRRRREDGGPPPPRAERPRPLTA